MQRYREPELISNRSPVLLFGGSLAERRAWAEEAASHFEHEGPLMWVHDAAELARALQLRGGVVAVEDVSVFDPAIQGQILNCLVRQEERPKLVLGLRTAADVALQSGALRADLHYRLSVAQVDLSLDEVKQAIRAREPQRRAREAAKKKAAELAAKVSKTGATIRKPLVPAKPAASPVRPAPAKVAAKVPVKAKAAGPAKGKTVAKAKTHAPGKKTSAKKVAGKSARRR